MPHAVISEAKKSRAKSFRRDMTPAERKLWYALRAHRLNGLGWRRQVPLGRFILDFVCHDRSLVVEVDGGQHFSDRQARRDSARDRWLITQGYRVVRIANNEVLGYLEGVLEYLLNITTRSPLPPFGGARVPLGRAEGGNLRMQNARLTPLPALPHKGGGVPPAAPQSQNNEHLENRGAQK